MSGALTLGMFPFGLAGGPEGVTAGPPDDFDQIRTLLRILQGDGAELLVRAYTAVEAILRTLRREALPLAGITNSTPSSHRQPAGDRREITCPCDAGSPWRA
jgi:hypothetical protein